MSDSAYHRLDQGAQQEQPYYGETIDVEQRHNNSSAPEEDEFLLTPLIHRSDEEKNVAAVMMDKHWATAFKANVIVTIVAAVVLGVKAVNILAEDAASGAGFRRRLQAQWGEGSSSDSIGEFKNLGGGVDLSLLPVCIC